MPAVQPTKWIRAGWLIDGSGPPALENAFIGIRDGVVECIATTHPPDTPYEDLSDATILPALMDAHVHLAFSGSLDHRIRNAQLEHSLEEAGDAVRGHLTAQWRHGVVAVRDGGDRLGAALRCQRNGQLPAEAPVTVKACGVAWHAEGRYGRMLGKSLPLETVPGEELTAQTKTADHLKVLQSGLNSVDRFGHSGPPQFTQAVLQAMTEMAHGLDRPVMVHANGEESVRIAIVSGCDSIEHGYFMGEDNLQRLAERSTFWVPTVLPMAALAEADNLTAAQKEVARRTLAHQLSQIRRAAEMGVGIALGTDAGGQGVDHGAAVWQELKLYAKAGMRIEKAVQCATSHVARLLRLNGRGELRCGCRADFLSVATTPGRLVEATAGALSLWVSGRRRY